MRRLLRALLQAKPKPAPKEEEPALDAEAVVEELPSGPKPLIEVTTSIQPLTEEEAQSVLGTTKSDYFLTTFRKTLSSANLTLTDEQQVKIAEPAKEFVWPKPEDKAKNKSESRCRR